MTGRQLNRSRPYSASRSKGPTLWWQGRCYQATLAGILPNGRQPAVDDSRDSRTVRCVQTAAPVTRITETALAQSVAAGGYIAPSGLQPGPPLYNFQGPDLAISAAPSSRPAYHSAGPFSLVTPLRAGRAKRPICPREIHEGALGRP